THISVVFLAGDHAYKIKKPVEMGFLDFRALEQRRHFCDEEVRLNRRLAPSVYLGVVPVTRQNGGLTLEGAVDVVDWAVKMRLLADEGTLQKRLISGGVDDSLVRSLARAIAQFHATAETNERIASFGRFDIVARNARENFTQSEAHVGKTVSRAVFERVRELTERALQTHHA